MSKPTAPLSEFVVVDTSPARADRMWSELRPRLDRSPRQRRGVLRVSLLAGALLMAFGAGVFLSRQTPRSGWAELHTAAGVTSVRLQDGSLLTLEPHTSLSVREQSGQSVQLALESGRVQCDVTHAPERVFSVAAAEHEVLVRGTRFLVELSRQRNELAVEVQSGSVEVRRARAASAEALLGAGQRWSVALEPPAAESAAGVPRGNAAPSPLIAAPDAGASGPPASRQNTPAMPASREPAAASPGNGLRAAKAGQGSSADQGARSLFDRGNAARRRGDLAAAAQAYEQLLRDHPGDAHVGLAAFELGRLRMDEFHDVHGAIEVLQLVVRAAKEDALREDGLARLVRAHQLLTDREQCQSARAEYLQAYPTGTHVLAVLKACDGL